MTKSRSSMVVNTKNSNQKPAPDTPKEAIKASPAAKAKVKPITHLVTDQELGTMQRQLMELPAKDSLHLLGMISQIVQRHPDFDPTTGTVTKK